VVADPDREENAMQSWEITRRGFVKELAVAIGLSVLRTAEAAIAARQEPCHDADPEFDLAFSFAGGDREYVAGTKAACDRLGLRVMYDEDMTNRWWGENFIAEQRRMYGGRALFFVPFLSTDYFRRTIPPDERVQLIAVSDIGAFATLAFADPRRFVGQAIELAGDELSLDQLLSAITRATGRDVADIAGRTPTDPPTAAGEFAAMTSSFCGWRADIPTLRMLHPALLDFDSWLAHGGKPLLVKHFRETDARCSVIGTEGGKGRRR